MVVIMVVLAAIFGIALLVLMYGVGIFNRLVALRNRVDNAFSQIEVQLKRRYDLIPNLIETVKGYMAHERETLEAVIKARNTAVAGLQAAAADPANPYGALLAWPATTSEAARPRRVAGAWLVCIAGRPVILAAAGGRQVLTFAGVAPGQLDSAFAHLAHLPRGRRRRALLVERIDDLPARESPYAARLLAAGFTADYGGLLAPSVL